jgi:DNA-binding response OmpR family regulator
MILVVDDEAMFLSVLEVTLGGRYVLLKARSAREALELLESQPVDLVISDVMMPGMDGYALCQRIKSTVDYSLIPVLLLTAKNTLEAKVAGLELGADAYIEKPFSEEHLLAQIASLLYNRQKLAEYFAASTGIGSAGVGSTGIGSAGVGSTGIGSAAQDQPKTENKFLRQLEQMIRDNMHDSDLDVERLAEMMMMSRISLYRKVKEASALSPAELITIARLRRAVELLGEGDYRIYEISDMVGFSSAGSFTRNFLRQFGVTPSDYFKGRHRDER